MLIGGCSLTDPRREGPGSRIWIAPPDAKWQPVVDDAAVYFKTREHMIFSVSRRTGVARWSAPTNVGGSWSYGGNAVIVGDLVIFPDYWLFAFDRANGARRWRFAPEEQGVPGYGPGAYSIAADDSTVYAGSGSGQVYAVRATTGTARWTTTLASDSITSVFDPLIDASSVYVHVTHFTNPLTGEVVALDRRTGTVRWSRAFTPAVPAASNASDMTLYGDLVIVSLEDGTVRAIDKATGSDRWLAPRLADVAARDDLRPIVAAGNVIVAGSTTTHLTGYDANTGAMLWQVDPRQGSSIDPMATDGKSVYVVFSNGVLGAFEATTGLQRWLLESPSVNAYPLATTTAVYAPSQSGLIALRP